MIATLVAPDAGGCATSCLWRSSNAEIPHIHAEPEIFSGLRDVTADQLDKVMSTFTEDDWNWIESGLFSHIRSLVGDILCDVLSFRCDEQTDDLLFQFWRIYKAYDATWPADQQTAQGV
ncbi:hypothetical protein [Pseudosporangium ferrugineum]|uniref:Uncharacterized protein n=1 Tax=Pseudosporangium ferrugineum TaxID=439699 RepID=A0A2T0RS92_9ACTN|nr:hypothetical protein [Pseudosporangium ferrugineum]PRY24038.1 hypothetical protein CLV70_114171 [Pseudosporangium ferrugineum]